MARPLRIQGEGLTYHVTGRGTGRMTIYRDDADRCCFLSRLAEVAETHGLLCPAYCLMTNHYHLVVTTTRPNLSDAARQLNGCYAQRWNRRHDHVGHLFQGRFNAQVVQTDRDLAAVCRYVVLNPVRGGLVDSPEEWPWSSYRATIGLAPPPPFLNVELLLGTFGTNDPASGAALFREFVTAAPAGAPRPPSGVLLGDSAFKERFRQTAAAASREVPRQQRQVRPDLDALFAGAVTRRARAAQMAEAYRLGYPMTEIARHLDIHCATVSKAIRAVRGGVRS